MTRRNGMLASLAVAIVAASLAEDNFEGISTP
jgi:hypothetical protein